MPTYPWEVDEVGWPQTKNHWLSGGTVERSATFMVKTSRLPPSLKNGSPILSRRMLRPALAGAPFCVPGWPGPTVMPPPAHEEPVGAEGDSSLPQGYPAALVATTR